VRARVLFVLETVCDKNSYYYYYYNDLNTDGGEPGASRRCGAADGATATGTRSSHRYDNSTTTMGQRPRELRVLTGGIIQFILK